MAVDPDGLLARAGAALEAGRADQASELLRPVCEAGKGGARHWFLLGTARGMAGDAAGAEAALREAVRLEPGHPQARLNLARALVEQGRHEESASLLQDLLARHPGQVPARLALAETLLRLGRHAEAETQARTLAGSAPPGRPRARALTLLARALQARQETDAALDAWEQALSAQPDLVPALMGKGTLLRLKGRDREALDCFDAAVRLAPDHAGAWHARGLTRIVLDDLEQAAADLERAFRLDPRDVAAGAQLASVYRHLRRIPESVEVSRRILEVDPDNAKARFYVQAFESNENGEGVQRIPREVAELTYSDPEVGRHFEASLKGGLQYRAPDALDAAVRKVCAPAPASLDILELGCGTGLCGSRFADVARRLVGTDLSPAMLDVAREKNAYTELRVADLMDVLAQERDAFDLVIAMDVLCYFGDLGEIFHRCSATLRERGVFAFSVEKPDHDEDWQLHPYGHFVHSLRHIRQVAADAGLREAFSEEMVLRREAHEPRVGYLCLFRRGTA